MSQVDFNETFRNEVSELLDRLEQSLLDLESKPADQDLVDSAFRALHTIKGSGAMFGFEHVAAFTHEFESLFDRIRKGEARISPEVVAISLAAKDHIRSLVDNPDTANEAEGNAILARLQTVTSGKAAAPVAAAHEAKNAVDATSESGMATWVVRMRFKRNVLLNGANPLLLLDELRGLGECRIEADVSEVPTLDSIDPEQCYMSWTAWLTTSASRSDIEYVFVFVADEMDLEIERVGAETVDAPQGLEVVPVALPGRAGEHVSAPAAKDAPAIVRPSKADTTIRVQAERLDELMDRVGELVIMQARLAQIAERTSDTAIRLVSEEIARLTHGLRDTTMGIRLVPIGSLFTRFRRLVHDLSRDLAKPVEFVTSGEETELDKTVVERLADPLVHVIRNAIDHGLENPDARANAGKPTAGRISLSARAMRVPRCFLL